MSIAATPITFTGDTARSSAYDELARTMGGCMQGPTRTYFIIDLSVSGIGE